MATTLSNTTFSNPCIRCGKERIDGKSWKEKVVSHFGTSYIVHTETRCPDKECQKIVEAKMDALRKKSEEIRVEKIKKNEERLQSNRDKAALKHAV